MHFFDQNAIDTVDVKPRLQLLKWKNFPKMLSQFDREVFKEMTEFPWEDHYRDASALMLASKNLSIYLGGCLRFIQNEYPHKNFDKWYQLLENFPDLFKPIKQYNLGFNPCRGNSGALITSKGNSSSIVWIILIVLAVIVVIWLLRRRH